MKRQDIAKIKHLKTAKQGERVQLAIPHPTGRRNQPWDGRFNGRSSLLQKIKKKSIVFSAKTTQPRGECQKRATPLWTRPIHAELTSVPVNRFDLLRSSAALNFC